MRSGYCSPRCMPSYGTGHRGYHGVAHRLVSGRAGGGVPGDNPWWDPNGEGLCVWAAYQPKGAVDLATSYLDLSGNGNNTGPGVAPTWDAVNGWKFNGTTQYLTTGFVPEVDQSQTCLCQFSDVPDDHGGVLFGMRNTTGVDYHFLVLPDNGVGHARYANGDPVVTVTDAGYNAGNAGVAGNYGYKDGLVHSPVLLASPVGPIYALWIGGLNRDGALSVPIQAYVQSFAIYDCTLTAPQVLSVATAMALL